MALSGFARHCAKMPCNVARCGTSASPMYSASCAKMFRALSFKFAVPFVTHWNRNGKSSGHLPSSRIPAASSQMVSHALRTMERACSSCRSLSSSPLTPSCVCCCKFAHRLTSSLVRTRRSRIDAISRVSCAPEVRIARVSCRQSRSGCFLHSLNSDSYCTRAALSAELSPPSSCSNAVRLLMSSTAATCAAGTVAAIAPGLGARRGVERDGKGLALAAAV
mmetsp:Transcript_10179/g.42788  ORF Transcript_10179/g.42788 Transcript_10179/m.42788 type:complete len:221 (-) Transcript_10179:108-770(-)